MMQHHPHTYHILLIRISNLMNLYFERWLLQITRRRSFDTFKPHVPAQTNDDLYPSDDQQPSRFDVLMPRRVYQSDLANWDMATL